MREDRVITKNELHSALLSVCIMAVFAIAAFYSIGRDEGYDKGYDEGYDEGYSTGCDEIEDRYEGHHYENGYEDGYEDGMNDGTYGIDELMESYYEDGYNDGYADALAGEKKPLPVSRAPTREKGCRHKPTALLYITEMGLST